MSYLVAERIEDAIEMIVTAAARRMPRDESDERLLQDM